MRRLIISFISLWLMMTITIIASLSLPIPNRCELYPALEFQTQVNAERTLVDFRTGIQWRHTFSPVSYWLSPDGNFHLSRTNEGILVRDVETQAVILTQDVNTFVNLTWAEDSNSLLVWEYLSATSQSQVTSFDIGRQEMRYQQQFPTSIRWRRQDNNNTDYLYSQLVLGGEEIRYGVQFFDVQSGDVTRFENPTQFPYVWSANGRYVASSHRVVISIIDPTTGAFHPNFTEPFIGQEFQWQGDDALWFNRLRDERNSIWRADLADGSITQILDNARLDAISSDGDWAYVQAFDIRDMALVYIPSGTLYPLSIMRDNQRIVTNIAFSPNGHCVSITIDEPQTSSQRLLVFDLVKQRIISQSLVIQGTYNGIVWESLDEVAIVEE